LDSTLLPWRLAEALGARLSVRWQRSQGEAFGLSTKLQEPLALWQDQGLMLTAYVAGGVGYCATAELSAEAIEAALRLAISRARLVASSGLLGEAQLPLPEAELSESSKFLDQVQPMLPRAALINLLIQESEAAHAHASVVASEFKISLQQSHHRHWLDGVLINEFETQFVEPHAQVTVAIGGDAQTRTLAGRYNGYCQQGGFEVIERSGLLGCGERLALQATQLAAAENCPSGKFDLLLMPDQMMLQIHESIGHPLELDRILGDERNFAGTSFVGPEMFGHYQYGSPLLNVSFDPDTYPHQLASYAKDDEGFASNKTLLIEKGILKRPLGSALSVARAQAHGVMLEGVSNARAIGWHRPTIDRMANLNVEPGDSTLEEMIADVEFGVMMRTNVSWSIDDSRNKFQFGCEWGQVIRQGQLAEVVKNPGYRGISAEFWRSLRAVGNESTHEVMGTPFCGKGEPGQVIRVGHASPACLFSGIEVFGGQA
jgi:predicted Zn-dependent protease